MVVIVVVVLVVATVVVTVVFFVSDKTKINIRQYAITNDEHILPLQQV